MERVFFVKNGDLQEVNNLLQKGGRIKMIQPVAETVAAYGYHATGGMCNVEEHGNYKGTVYAYVVVEFN